MDGVFQGGGDSGSDDNEMMWLLVAGVIGGAMLTGVIAMLYVQFHKLNMQVQAAVHPTKPPVQEQQVNLTQASRSFDNL